MLAGLTASGDVFVSYGGFSFADSDPSKGGIVYLLDPEGKNLKLSQIQLLYYSPKSDSKSQDWFTLLGLNTSKSVIQYRTNPVTPGGILSQQSYT